VVADAKALGEALRRFEARPVLVLVDDAETVSDDDGVIASLLTQAACDLHVIAAGRADRLRGAYGHWTTSLRRSATGLALRPDVDVDGDLWGVRFPRQVDGLNQGRGLLVCDGTVEVVQVAAP
jgi:S-DNA-T family DNA segregation ATPase FtsK/SpoIIIE